MKQLTREEAIRFGESGVWREWTDLQIVRLQLFQDCLCVPLDIYYAAIKRVLHRPVLSHEFSTPNIEALRAECLGDKPSPTWEEIIALIPPEKRIIVGGEP